MRAKIITAGILIFSMASYGYSQSLKGKARMARMEDAEMESTVKYGNVEAYDKNGKLVASVLTDALGNYSIDFKDSGTYEINIMYAGFEPVKEAVYISGDEVSDFAMKRDESKKVRMAPKPTSHVPAESGMGIAHHSSSSIAHKWSGGISRGGMTKDLFGAKRTKSGAGLTAGEINDFAKWDLWNDMVARELEIHQKVWKLNPSQRYMIQLMNAQKSPIVGAEVSLMNRADKVLWKTITDNTGKAELWGSINGDSVSIGSIEVVHEGISKTIKDPTRAKEGVNTLIMETQCDTKNIVDVAFVIDATGSMADEISFIQSDLNTVIYNSQNLYQDVALRYASVFYRDEGDAYVTKHKDFTNVLSEALVFIDEQGADGGGDTPEAVDKGLEVALNQLTWSEDARSRILFLVLDAEAHSDAATIQRLQTLAEDAANKGIKIIPVAASGINKSGEYLMRSLALCTNGKYVFLTNHSGIGNSHIEPSTDEYEVELLSERLTTIIKNNMFYPACEELIPDYETNLPDSLVQYPYPIEVDSLSNLDSLAVDTLNTRVPNDSLNVENPIDRIEWKFYPNPTSDFVNIEVSENVELIYLTDLSGKLLQQISFMTDRKQTISLGSYPSGIYLLRYPVGKHWVTGKIVLTRL